MTKLRERLAKIKDRIETGREATAIRNLIAGMTALQADYPRLTVERYCALREAGVEAGGKKKAGEKKAQSGKTQPAGT